MILNPNYSQQPQTKAAKQQQIRWRSWSVAYLCGGYK